MIETINKNPLIQAFENQKCWINWQLEEQTNEKGKLEIVKVPKKSNRLGNAKPNDTSTWSTFAEVDAVKEHFSGIGIMLDDKLLGIDLDHCIEDGKISEEISTFISLAQTYTEISPSGKGLHLYLKLTEPLRLERNKAPRGIGADYEVYTSGRWFTVTGDMWKESYELRAVTPDEAIELISFLGYPWASKPETKKEDIATTKNVIPLSDEELLERMFASKNGDKIRSIYEGDISFYNGDDSSADLGLCAHLAYWSDCNKIQIERIWLNSPLGNREKTQTRQDYRDFTIAKAIDSQKKNKKDSSLVVLPEKNFKILFSSNPKQTSFEIARYLISKYYVKTIGDRIREIYIYKDGIYVLGLNILKAEIQEILEESASTNTKNNIIEMIKDLTVAYLTDFNTDKNFINLNNGIYDLKKKEFFSHNPNFLFFSKFPVDYDANAKCPVIENFLNEILTEDYVRIILEWFGYCLYRNYFIKKAIIFVGEKDTGKSTLIKLFESFIGKDNVSGISLQKISSDKFASSYLCNKFINIYDDLSFKDISDNGLFKIATGGGVISGERKFGEQFQFQSFSKLTFACNKIPDVKDTNDDAYFSRWIIIPFLAQITKVDKFLTDKMRVKTELSGLLNLALIGLEHILKTQDFSYGKTPEEIKQEMLLSGSMVANFVKECLEESDGSWISKDDMYEKCAKYAKFNNLPVLDKKFLGRKLPNHSGYIIDGTKTIDKKQVQGWLNVKFTEHTE